VNDRLAERVLSAGPLAQWHEAIRRTFEDLDLAFKRAPNKRM